jgi:hypothetical protein
MAFMLSPGVNFSEIDLTTIVPAVGTTEGAFAGDFVWGPINTVVSLSNEVELVNIFGKPTNETFRSFFSAANFLSYARRLRVVRAANTAIANNATDGTYPILIQNRDDYEVNYLDLSAPYAAGHWAARYAGALGNSLKVSEFAGSANSTAWSSWEYREEFNGVPGTSAYAAKVGGSKDEMHVIVVDEDGKFSGTAGTILEKFPYVSKASDATNDDGSSNYYVNVINDRSRYIYILNHPADANITLANIANVQIINPGNNYSNGTVSFTSNTGSGVGATARINVNATNAIVTFLVTANGSGFLPSDSITVDLSTRIANNDPNMLLSMASANLKVNTWSYTYQPTQANWGQPASGRTFEEWKAHYTGSLTGGADGTPSAANLVNAYDKFSNAEEVDVSLVVTGAAPQTVAEHVLDNITSTRRDCVGFISPEFDDVVNNAGNEVIDTVAYRNNFNSTSYGVMDCNWKYQFDKYNNVNRWVPLNGDIAGLCVRTDYERDPWFSPAGFNRGHIKNVIKLAWNPTQADRDDLYKNGINPVVSFPGEGAILYGDKTMLTKPSAFDRINVRRLFIVLEKAITRAARYSLFEFNDEFTRAQFVALVEPFLRDVQGRRGIYDFRVVCDTTNNTPEVIDRNEFVGDIYIKPARAINFIQLNFVAVRTGVAFEEIVGKF